MGVKPIKFLSPFPFIYSTTETKPTNRLQHIKVKAKTLVKRLQFKSNATVTPDYDGHFEADISAKEH